MSHLDLETLYWMLWMAAAGACTGSFVNVLIYRLPRQIRLTEPRHSFCPHCRLPIRWRDNIPLLSYLALGGRCRHCRAVIPCAYPLIEGLAAMLFMLLVDAFHIGAVRTDFLTPDIIGITAHVGANWPFLVSHVVLAAGLLTISAIDLEEYYVDIRITWTIVAVGLACHVFGALPDGPEYALTPRAAAVTLAAVAGLAASWTVQFAWSRTRRTDRSLDEPADITQDQVDPSTTDTTQQDQSPPSPIFGLLVVVLFLLLITGWALLVSINGEHQVPPPQRLAIVFALLFLALVASSARSRPADTLIVEAIENERHEARRTALRELLFLLPALALAGATFWWFSSSRAPASLSGIERVLDWPGGAGWHPIRGLLWATMSVLIAAALGWGVRIVFTLALGREALGFGDVHILAAAGAVVGWALVVIGFFAAACLAVLGMILLLAFKRSRAIPFGPWLALGILLLVLARDPVLAYFAPALEGIFDLLTKTAL